MARQLPKEQVEEVVQFLTQNELTREPKEAGWRHFAGMDKRREKSFLSKSVHGYLFFRIPLVRPQVFLDAAWPFISWIFTSTFLKIVAILGIVALWLVSRQWDVFIATFAGFLTLEGAAAYGAVLVLVKIIHELGHAFMARKYNAYVSTLGVAFIVLFPILYTDTTAAWQLERRKRLLIDGGGILAELSLAVIATLFWVFLPDGTMRSVAFVVATVSWVLSLAVNLNPLMRFDGYYLLSDAAGVENLQERGFAMARWRLRETLLGFGEAAPEKMKTSMRRALIVHAFATWVYRFFLFLGIALIVYHMFFKVAGIALFIVEIVWFIGLPIWREIKQWYTRRENLSLNFATVRTLLCTLGFLAIVLVPWQRTIMAPAVLTATNVSQVFAGGHGQIVEHHLIEGRSVRAGDVLALIEDVELNAQILSTQRSIDLLKVRLARSTADAEDRSYRQVLERELSSRNQELQALQSRADDLIVRAASDGVLTGTILALKVGDYVSSTTRLGLITSTDGGIVRGYVASSDIERIGVGSEAKFVPEEPEIKTSNIVVADLAPIVQSDPLMRMQFDVYGGAIATSQNAETNELGPAAPVYQAVFAANEPLPSPALEMRGTVHIDAKARSIAYRVVRQIAGVLIRESGF